MSTTEGPRVRDFCVDTDRPTQRSDAYSGSCPAVPMPVPQWASRAPFEDPLCNVRPVRAIDDTLNRVDDEIRIIELNPMTTRRRDDVCPTR